MTQQAELYREIDTLPPQYLGEIFDLVAKLRYKSQQKAHETTANENSKTRLTIEQMDEMVRNCESLRSLTGILKTDMSLEEIRMKRLAKHL